LIETIYQRGIDTSRLSELVGKEFEGSLAPEEEAELARLRQAFVEANLADEFLTDVAQRQELLHRQFMTHLRILETMLRRMVE